MTVSDLLQRLQAQVAAGGPMDLAQIREDIHTEHERATTTIDREANRAFDSIFVGKFEVSEKGLCPVSSSRPSNGMSARGGGPAAKASLSLPPTGWRHPLQRHGRSSGRD
jgi:hypothetical protein